MRLSITLCLVVALASTPAASGEAPRSMSKAIPGSATVVVVAEGELEPRSIGSYSLRTYAGSNPRAPHDDFVAGVVRPRDGTIEDVRFADLDGDGAPEIVVVIRSAGSGGYLSADAFRLRRKVPVHLASVAGLAKDADPVRALEAKLATRRRPRAPDVQTPQPPERAISQ